MLSAKWLWLFLISTETKFLNAKRLKRSPILGGDEARKNQFPYAVAVTSVNRDFFICSGGIVSEKHILTAAHCFTDKQNQFQDDEYIVFAGAFDLDLPFDKAEMRAGSILTIYIPKDFDWKTRRSDISIVELSVDLMIEEYHLQKLQFPMKDEKIEIGVQTVAAGFGACKIEVTYNGTERIIGDYEIDGKLRYATIEIVDKAKCHDVPYGNFTIEDYHLLGKMVKDSSEIYGMCYGDSGSSLVYKSNVVIAVMVDAFDQACEGRILPAIFTTVSDFALFIKNAMEGNINDDIRVKNIPSITHDTEYTVVS